MTVTPYMHTIRGLDYHDVLEGLAAGRRQAAELGVDFAWVFDIPGQYGQPGAKDTVRWAVEQPPDGLVGFGLAGAEAARPRGWPTSTTRWRPRPAFLDGPDRPA
jgi:aminodeoxyfutalosine deaminase